MRIPQLYQDLSIQILDYEMNFETIGMREMKPTGRPVKVSHDVGYATTGDRIISTGEEMSNVSLTSVEICTEVFSLG